MRSIDLDRLWPTIAVGMTNGAAKAPDQQPRSMSVPDIETQWVAETEPAAITRAMTIGVFLRAFDTNAAVWLSMGFIAGMASWHATEVWHFLAPAHETRSTIAAVSPAPRRTTDTGQITTGSLSYFSPRPDACVALALDRSFGATKALPCNGGIAPQRDAGQRRKADRTTSIGDRFTPNVD